MTPEDLREILQFLEARVRLEGDGTVVFEPPDEAEMVAAGLHADGARRLLAAAWWDEMVEEVVETPEFCAPDDPPETVLGYARDVVGEYIRKRFTLG